MGKALQSAVFNHIHLIYFVFFFLEEWVGGFNQPKPSKAETFWYYHLHTVEYFLCISILLKPNMSCFANQYPMYYRRGKVVSVSAMVRTVRSEHSQLGLKNQKVYLYLSWTYTFSRFCQAPYYIQTKITSLFCNSGSRLADFNIFVGKSADMEICAYFKGPGENAKEHKIPCRQPRIGRYVRIEKLSNTEPLTLCEVEIFGTPGFSGKLNHTTLPYLCDKG